MAMALALIPEGMSSIGRFYPSRRPPGIPTLVCHSVSFAPRCQINLKAKVEKSLFKHELQAAVDVVEKACRLCLLVQAGLNPNEDEPMQGVRLEKSDASPVTVADLGVQALVSLELGLLFPSIPLVGEEDSSYLRDDLSNHKTKTYSNQDQPLVETVAQAVASVASPILNPVTTDSILNALDRGGKSIAETETSSTAYWILDPIDGTRGFIRGGAALYVVGLALVVAGEVVLGVMGCPRALYKYDDTSVSGVRSLEMTTLQQNTERGVDCCERANGIFTGDYQSGLLMAACSGCGCWVKPLSWSPFVSEGQVNNFNDIVESKVNRCMTLREASFCISDNEVWRTLPLALALASAPASGDRLLEHEAQTVPICCGSLCKYFAVALGSASVFVQYVHDGCQVKVWDHAAGVICVVEAGGQVTDGKGTHLKQMLGNGQRVASPEGGVIVASNGTLHEIVLRNLSCTEVSK